MARPVVDLSQVIRRGPPPSGLCHYTRGRAGMTGLILLYLAVIVLPLLVFLPPTLLLTVVAHWVARRFLDYCVASWMTFVSFTFRYVLGIKTRLFGYRGNFKKRSLIIMNHVSHLDWLYFWSVSMAIGDLTTWKVVTKKNIRHLPAVGQCMQLACLLFISRSWEEDEAEFRRKLDYFNSLGYPCQMLLFPEGRDISDKNKAASDKYAEKNGLPQLHYTLHPRQKGFTYIMEKMRQEALDAVYDVTIAFPDNMPKTEGEFFNGVMPRGIDFHIKSYSNSELPTDERSLGEWCQQRWLEKEELLHSYYTSSNSFDKSVPVTAVASGRDSQSLGVGSAVLWLVALNTVACCVVVCVGWWYSLVWCVGSLLVLGISYSSLGLDGLMLLTHSRATQQYIATMKQN